MHRYFILLISILFAGAMSAQDLRHYEYLRGSSIGEKVRRLGGEEQKERLGGEEQKGRLGGEEFSSRKEADTLNHASIRDLYFFTQMPGLPKSGISSKKWVNKLYDKVFQENLILIKRPGYLITADPLFDTELGRANNNPKNTWLNVRGVQVYGKIDLDERQKTGDKETGDERQKTEDRRQETEDWRLETENCRLKTFVPTFEFYSSYYEAQIMPPRFLDSLASVYGGMPGQGSVLVTKGIYEHSYATAWARYKASKYFTFEAGTGKNFFGNGYRSMMLSDNARNAPYFRIDTRLWRMHYTNLWTEYQDNNYLDGPMGSYQKKYGAFHYLSYSITNRLELGLFEGIIWQGRDSLHNRGFEVSYLNPVIFLRPVEWTLGSPDNAIAAMNLSYRFLDETYLYGQFTLDDFPISHIKARDGYWGNKYAGQIGAKTYITLHKSSPVTRHQSPVFSTQSSVTSFQSSVSSLQSPESSHQSPVTRHQRPLVIPSALYFQTELNFARPYTFSHWSTKENYGHLGQPLAHPLGANFVEWVNFARVNWNRLTIEGRYSLMKFGANYNGQNWGQDIFISFENRVNELGNYIGQGLATTLTYKTITASYLLNPASLLNIFLSLSDRNQVSEAGTNHSLWFTFGVRNSLRNLYYDY
jgi:hypothetical protein